MRMCAQILKINKILKFQSPIRRNLLKKKKILFFEVQFAGTFSEIMKKCLKIVRQIQIKRKSESFRKVIQENHHIKKHN